MGGDRDNINNLGGKDTLMTLVWRNIISKSQNTTTTVQTFNMETLDVESTTIPNKYAKLITTTSEFLNITPTEFKQNIMKRSAAHSNNANSLQNKFQTARQKQELDTLATTIDTFIMQITTQTTSETFALYDQHLRKKEAENNLKASIAAAKQEDITTQVNNILTAEEPISATKMMEFITSIATKEAQKMVDQILQKNSNGHQKNNKTKRKNTNNDNDIQTISTLTASQQDMEDKQQHPNKKQKIIRFQPADKTKEERIIRNDATSTSTPTTKNNYNHWGKGRGRGRGRGRSRGPQGGYHRGRGNWRY